MFWYILWLWNDIVENISCSNSVVIENEDINMGEGDKQTIGWAFLAVNIFISWNHMPHMTGLATPSKINTKSTEMTV